MSNPATVLQRLRQRLVISRAVIPRLLLIGSSSSNTNDFIIKRKKYISHGRIYARLRCSRVCVKSRSGCCSQAAKRLRRYGRRTTYTVEPRYLAMQAQRRFIQIVPNECVNKRNHTRAEQTDTHRYPPRTASIRCAEEAPRAELLLLRLLVDPLPSPAPLAPIHLGLKVALRHRRGGEGLCNLAKTKPEWPH